MGMSSDAPPDLAGSAGYPLSPMSFRPEALHRSPPGAPGHIDYRLNRRHAVAEYRRGRLGRLDVCDAHPELLRAARNMGRPTTDDCPICEEADLVHVTFAFGSRLPASGRCVGGPDELAKLARRPGEIACYVVEVCLECSWNHLVRAFLVGQPRTG